MRLLIWIVFAALSLGTMQPSLAAGDHDRARSAVRAGEVLSLGPILATVRRQFPGRVLDANLSPPGPEGRRLYRVKVLRPNGNVLLVIVNGRTGAILGTQ